MDEFFRARPDLWNEDIGVRSVRRGDVRRA
jgi:hypothetical protein